MVPSCSAIGSTSMAIPPLGQAGFDWFWAKTYSLRGQAVSISEKKKKIKTYRWFWLSGAVALLTSATSSQWLQLFFGYPTPKTCQMVQGRKTEGNGKRFKLIGVFSGFQCGGSTDLHPSFLASPRVFLQQERVLGSLEQKNRTNRRKLHLPVSIWVSVVVATVVGFSYDRHSSFFQLTSVRVGLGFWWKMSLNTPLLSIQVDCSGPRGSILAVGSHLFGKQIRTI